MRRLNKFHEAIAILNQAENTISRELSIGLGLSQDVKDRLIEDQMRASEAIESMMATLQLLIEEERESV